MNCNIIRDLLPSYLDDICSEETKAVVEDHLQTCTSCQEFVTKMVQADEITKKELLPDELAVATEPFKEIKRKKRLHMGIAIVVTIMVMLISGVVIQEVGAVNQVFFPDTRGIAIVSEDEEWGLVHFENQHYVEFDSIFWSKEIVNIANNPGPIDIRIKDEAGNIVIGEVTIEEGTGLNLDVLNRNEKYYLEVKAEPGDYWLNIH